MSHGCVTIQPFTIGIGVRGFDEVLFFAVCGDGKGRMTRSSKAATTMDCQLRMSILEAYGDRDDVVPSFQVCPCTILSFIMMTRVNSKTGSKKLCILAKEPMRKHTKSMNWMQIRHAAGRMEWKPSSSVMSTISKMWSTKGGAWRGLRLQRGASYHSMRVVGIIVLRQVAAMSQRWFASYFTTRCSVERMTDMG